MKTRLVIVFLFLLPAMNLEAQTMVRMTRYLLKPLTLEVTNARLDDVLEMIGKKGNFYFSYSSALISRDSLVTMSVTNTPVKDILDELLKQRFEYLESPGYIILRPAFRKLSITPESIRSGDNVYFISGYVTDEKTGAALKDVSVYEKRLLKSTLTDKAGYFRLGFRGDHKLVMLSASRENYRDTTVMFLSGINISPQGYDDTTAAGGSEVSALIERIGLGRFLVSSKQRIQSLNIPDFLANTPFQASLTPGLSSHGMMSSSVVNKVSLNVLGGYTAGVDGVEIAGLFNINKGYVRYMQTAGLSNMVGGSVHGLQVAGIMNTVLNNVTGVQVGGVLNSVRDSLHGFQTAGVLNTVRHLEGVQVAGIGNYSRDTLLGVQIAGVTNISNNNLNGVQVAGVLNVSRLRLRGAQIGLINFSKVQEGLQIGLINVADTSSGYSIGLFNWVTRGYHKVSISVNEVMNTNIGIKTGNSRLYTMIVGGLNASANAKVYAAGVGLGHDFLLNNRFAISAELSSRYMYIGNAEDINLLNRFESNVQLRMFKSITLFAGPSYNILSSNSSLPASAPGFKSNIAPENYHTINDNKGWVGWNIGISFFLAESTSADDPLFLQHM